MRFLLSLSWDNPMRIWLGKMDLRPEGESQIKGLELPTRIEIVVTRWCDTVGFVNHQRDNLLELFDYFN